MFTFALKFLIEVLEVERNDGELEKLLGVERDDGELEKSLD